MRFRGKAVLVGAAVLSAALAFNKPPIADVYAKGNKAAKPKYEPQNWKKGDGKAAAALKKARNIPPRDYKLDYIKGAVDNGKPLVNDVKINEKGFFVFKIKKVNPGNGITITGNVKIKYIKKKDEFYAKIVFYQWKGKGKWICGIPLTKLAKRYKEKTKKELEFVTFGMKKKGDGNIDFFVVPVETLEDAKNGSIKAGVPVLIILYKKDKNVFASSFGRNVHNIVE